MSGTAPSAGLLDRAAPLLRDGATRAQVAQELGVTRRTVSRCRAALRERGERLPVPAGHSRES